MQVNVRKENEAGGQKGMRVTSVQAVEAVTELGRREGSCPAEETCCVSLGDERWVCVRKNREQREEGEWEG